MPEDLAEENEHLSVALAQRPLFTLRNYRPEVDRAYLLRTWFDVWRRGDAWVRVLEPRWRATAFDRCADSILAQSPVIRIAADLEDSDVILGFAITQPTVVWCCYVREAFRKMGIGRALMVGLDLSAMDWGMQSGDWHMWLRHKVRMRHYRPFFMEG